MQPTLKRYGVPLWLIGIVLVVTALCGFLIYATSSSDITEQVRKDMILRQQRADAQKAFEATPTGKKEKAAREKAQLNADAQKTAHYLLARSLESSFLDHGIDVKCEVAETDQTLMIVGEPVNRVFVHQFMRSPTIKSLRSAGLKTISFWNGHQLTGIYTEKYDITR